MTVAGLLAETASRLMAVGAQRSEELDDSGWALVPRIQMELER